MDLNSTSLTPYLQHYFIANASIDLFMVDLHELFDRVITTEQIPTQHSCESKNPLQALTVGSQSTVWSQIKTYSVLIFVPVEKPQAWDLATACGQKSNQAVWSSIQLLELLTCGTSSNNYLNT